MAARSRWEGSVLPLLRDPKTMSVINLFVERLRAAVREIAL